MTPGDLFRINAKDTQDLYLFWVEVGHDSGGPNPNHITVDKLTAGKEMLDRLDAGYSRWVDRGEHTWDCPWYYGGLLCAVPVNGGQAVQTDDGQEWYGTPEDVWTKDGVAEFMDETPKRRLPNREVK